MKIIRTALLSIIALGLLFSFAYAAGDAAKGKKEFNNPRFAGGSTACSSCHPDGKGLETAGTKKSWVTPAGPAKTLEEAINLCIVNANKGKAISVRSEQMKDMVAYIKSLAKEPEKPVHKRFKVPGY